MTNLKTAQTPVTQADITQARKEMIVSISGYRKIFGPDAESSSPSLLPKERALVRILGTSFAHFLLNQSGSTPAAAPHLGIRHTPTVVVGTDTRPTGPAIAQEIIGMLLAHKIMVQYLGVSATPEIMAYAHSSETIDAFVCITASHNPIGYNGFKFGLGDGTILGAAPALELQKRFDALCADTPSRIMHPPIRTSALARLLRTRKKWKREALTHYAHQTASITAAPSQPHPLHIVADFNGSARAKSIDAQFIRSLGHHFHAINGKAGKISHAILPEGAALKECEQAIEKLYQSLRRTRRLTPSPLIGYVCDNDGDRGNLLLFDTETEMMHLLSAQQVFALICTASLSRLDRDARSQKIAIAANGPTSLRIDAIAARFEADVFRAEVGEANIVACGENLRRKGFEVPVIGEGSNGGVIIPPSTVRDPLLMIGTIVQLPDIMAAMHAIPQYSTTEVDDPLAQLRIDIHDQSRFKTQYLRLFQKRWRLPSDKGGMPPPPHHTSPPIDHWEVHHYCGTEDIAASSAEIPPAASRGGMKVILSHANTAIASMWMRKSGTEPIFRLLVDTVGENLDYMHQLLQWHRNLIIEAANEGS